DPPVMNALRRIGGSRVLAHIAVDDVGDRHDALAVVSHRWNPVGNPSRRSAAGLMPRPKAVGLCASPPVRPGAAEANLPQPLPQTLAPRPCRCRPSVEKMSRSGSNGCTRMPLRGVQSYMREVRQPHPLPL